jgi:hypothetical protein
VDSRLCGSAWLAFLFEGHACSPSGLSAPYCAAHAVHVRSYGRSVAARIGERSFRGLAAAQSPVICTRRAQ